MEKEISPQEFRLTNRLTQAIGWLALELGQGLCALNPMPDSDRLVNEAQHSNFPENFSSSDNYDLKLLNHDELVTLPMLAYRQYACAHEPLTKHDQRDLRKLIKAPLGADSLLRVINRWHCSYKEG